MYSTFYTEVGENGQKRHREFEPVTVFERKTSATDFALILSQAQKLDVCAISSDSTLRTYLSDDGVHQRGRAHSRLESHRTRLTFSRASALRLYSSSAHLLTEVVGYVPRVSK